MIHKTHVLIIWRGDRDILRNFTIQNEECLGSGLYHDFLAGFWWAGLERFVHASAVPGGIDRLGMVSDTRS